MATREVGLPALPGAPGGKAWACTVTASWDELDAWLASALCAAQRGSPGTQASKRKRTAAAATGAGKGLVPVGGGGQAAVLHPLALDCEWAPPWYRGGADERVGTVQLYHPEAGALLFSLAESERRARQDTDRRAGGALGQALRREDVAIIGVNVAGDASRLVRDLKLAGGVQGLYDCAVHCDLAGRSSLQDLVKEMLPEMATAGAADKEADKGVRTSDWGAWPLSDAQVRYAAMDAALSYLVFAEIEPTLAAVSADKLASVDGYIAALAPTPLGEKEAGDGKAASAANANFFRAMRNRSMAPPNAGNKPAPPRGSKDALKGISVLVTGVLDSMSRDEMKAYVESHGGKMVKSVTKSLSYLVNDHGEVGPSKRAKCEKNDVPLVGEDAIFDLVRQASSKGK